MADKLISNEMDVHVDWRGKRAEEYDHGGGKAASVICVVEVLENMVFLSLATNIVTYFITTMHYSAAIASNMVTNFLATSFLLSIFGGFVGDSFLGKFWTFVTFSLIEILGLVLLIIQAEHKTLQPIGEETPTISQEALLYTGLYAMALGVGGIKSSLPAHGADQVDHSNQRRVTTFFNWFFFSLCMGGLLASTIMVWIQANKGWLLSFKLSAAALSLASVVFAAGMPFYKFKRPSGSPITRIVKVFISAARNRSKASAEAQTQGARESDEGHPNHKFKFLDKALADSTINPAHVQETRTFLGLLPIFACTILMNCCLAQLQTFSVQQGIIMYRTLGNFTIPTPSLTVFPLVIMLSSIPIYEIFSHSSSKNATMANRFFRPLRRIGIGLALAPASMAIAAVVEAKRREAANNGVILSVFWLVFQYLLLGLSDMMTLGGMLEFFYSEAPISMRSICTALSWCSTSMGYFLSSVFVDVSNSISGRVNSSGKQWLGRNDMNQNRLDLFYTLLCVLSFLNFLNYVFWARRY